MDEEYRKAIQTFREQMDKDLGPDDDYDEFNAAWYLAENNSFENTLDGKTAEEIIPYVGGDTNGYGGYPLWAEKSFKVNGETYTVIVYGNTSDEKNSIHGILFVKES